MLYGPVETSRRIRVGVHDLVFVLTTVSLLCFQMEGFTLDPGLGWHLKDGEQIWESGAVPFFDPFLGLPLGTPPRKWISDQWLGDVISFLLVRTLSWTGATLALLTLFLVPFLWFLYREIRSQIGLAISTTVAVFLAAKVASIHLIFRPVIFSFFFLCLVIPRTRRWAIDPGTITKRDYLWVFVVFALWANIHPSFVLGLAWCALVPISRLIERKLNNTSGIRVFGPRELGYFVIPVVAFVATCLNPYGIALHSSILDLTNNEFFMDFHREWQSPNFKSAEGVIAQFVIFTIIGAAFVDRSSGLRYHTFDVLGLLAASHLALESVRVLPLFIIVAVAPFSIGCTRIAVALRAAFPRSDLLAKLLDATSRIERAERSISGGAVGLVAVALILIGVAGSKTKFPGVDKVQGPSSAEYPYEAVAYLQSVTGSEERVVLSTPDWGGFITLQGHPSLRPVIDDRNTLLGETFYRQYFEAVRSASGIAALSKLVGAEYVLFPRSGHVAQLLQCGNGFTLVHKDELALVFRRNEST